MKKRLTKLDKNGYWWAKPDTDWATQDKDGNWWIITGSEFPEKKLKTNPSKRTEQTSSKAELKFCLFVVLASAMGVILATIIITYLMSL
jgi:hypothetical protein